jgi:alanyl aminopeptidase
MWWTAGVALAGGRLTDTVVPISQRIDLTLDPRREATSGAVVIRVRVTERTNRIELHADEHDLDVVRATIRPDGGTAVEVKVIQSPVSVLRLVAPDPLEPGIYGIEIAFAGRIQSQAYGLYRFDADEVAYVASQLEADEARTAWPCFDEPRFKIPFTLDVTVPSGLEVISNAPVASRTATEDGDRVVFRPTEPIPSYAVALLVGPYEATPVPGLDSIAWTVRGRSGHGLAIAEEAPLVLGALEEWFDSPQPFAKLDFVAVPEFAFGAMENPGAIVFAELVVAPPDERTQREAERTAHVVAHELSHLWFGDLVTMEWWDDFWLNEAFAEWMSEKIRRLLHPDQGGDVQRVESLAYMIREDGRSAARPLRTVVDPDAVFETVNLDVFPKGEALLDMVEAWIGEAAMQEGIRVHVASHAWDNATAEDMFDTLSSVSGHDVAAVLGPYLDTPGAPLLRFERTHGGPVRVSQDVYTVDGDEAPRGGPWTVPVRMRIGLPDGSTTVITRLVDPGTGSIDVPDHLWLHPAAEGIGYYAWSLADDDLDRLLAARPQLTAPERMSVLQSLELERSAGARSLTDVLSLLPAFDGESDPRVVAAIEAHVTSVAIARWMGDAALTERADAWIRERLRPMFSALGPATPDESGPNKELRIGLLRSLAAAGDRDARAASVATGEDALARPGQVDAMAEQWGLAALARYGPPGTEERLLGAIRAETDPRRKERLLEAYGGLHGPAGLAAAFAHAADPSVPASEMQSVLRGVRDRDDERERDLVLELAMQHDAAIRRKLSPTDRPYLVMFGNGCSVARATRAAAFYSHRDREAPGVDQATREMKARVSACRARVERDGPEIRLLLDVN